MFLLTLKKCLEHHFQLSIACTVILIQILLHSNPIGQMEHNQAVDFLSSPERQQVFSGSPTSLNQQTGCISVSQCRAVETLTATDSVILLSQIRAQNHLQQVIQQLRCSMAQPQDSLQIQITKFKCYLKDECLVQLLKLSMISTTMEWMS